MHRTYSSSSSNASSLAYNGHRDMHMPFTLRRSSRKEGISAGSFVDAVKTKIRKSHRREYNTYHNPEKPHSHSRRHHPSHKLQRTTQHVHLPPEILAYIFSLGVEEDPMLPLTASHVCRAWRELCLHTPSLWRRINLDARLLLWLQYIHRARACTLDVFLTPRSVRASGHRTYRGRHYLDAQSVEYYMHYVAPHLPRSRSLTIEFQHYAPYLWNAALSPLCGQINASNLEDLSLIYPANDDTKEFVLFGGYAPRLRRVAIHGVRLTWLPTLYGNITFLDYAHHGFTHGYDAAAEVLYMLQVSNQLRQLRVSFPSRNGTQQHTTFPTPFPSDASILLEQLTTLELRIESPPNSEIPSALIHFISHISTPSLLSLRLLTIPNASYNSTINPRTPLRYTDPGLSPRFRQLLKALPRLYTLERLELEHAWLSDPRFISGLLHVLPNLRTLTLRGPYVTNPFLFDLSELLRTRYLYYPSRSHPSKRYRKLDILELDNCDILTAEAVVDAVKHRLGECGCVGKVQIINCLSVDVAVLRRARLQYCGVEVKVWWKGDAIDLVRWTRKPR